MPDWIEGVTSDDIERTAATYRTIANRTVLDRKPVAKVATVTPPAGVKKNKERIDGKKLMLTLTNSMLFAPLAYAAEPVQLPATMPDHGKDKPIPAPHIGKRTPAHGMLVWVVPRSALPRVDHVLAARGTRNAADDATHPGFAKLMAGMLNEGTPKHTDCVWPNV